jgi:hypothetical protein
MINWQGKRRVCEAQRSRIVLKAQESDNLWVHPQDEATRLSEHVVSVKESWVVWVHFDTNARESNLAVEWTLIARLCYKVLRWKILAVQKEICTTFEAQRSKTNAPTWAWRTGVHMKVMEAHIKTKTRQRQSSDDRCRRSRRMDSVGVLGTWQSVWEINDKTAWASNDVGGNHINKKRHVLKAQGSRQSEMRKT